MLSPSASVVRADQREAVRHGTAEFPLACYLTLAETLPIPWHWHQELELGIVTSGTLTLTTPTGVFDLTAGDGFFINSGVLHRFTSLDSPVEMHSLVFHPRIVGGSLESVFHAKYVAPIVDSTTCNTVILEADGTWAGNILDCVERAWKAVVVEEYDFELVVRNVLSEALSLLSHNCVNPVTDTSTKDVRDAERLKHMLTYIHQNYGSFITVKDIAGSCDISESECLRCFRATIGTTPIDYVRQYRVAKAARLLGETSMTVAAIAQMTGFRGASYFSKTFRSLNGMTPKDYRAAQLVRIKEAV